MNRLKNLSLVQKFNIVSLIILLTCLVVLGRWVSGQIESQVLERVGHTTSLFAGSVIAPSVLEILNPKENAYSGGIEAILNSSGLGSDISSLKVWGNGGEIIYSSNREEIGMIYPIEAGLLLAWGGVVSAEISELDRDEHKIQRELSNVLLETYSPIREPGTGRIVAVVEFYQSAEAFQDELRYARRQSWAVSTMIIVAIYLSLMVLVRSGSSTIVKQRDELIQQVARYEILLTSNRDLHERLRLAAVRSTALNERYLRSIAAELHDGPAQEIGYALLNLGKLAGPDEGKSRIADIAIGVKSALERSLEEVRSISAGLRTPELENFSIEEVVRRAVRIHNRRTGARVVPIIDTGQSRGSLAANITLYRVVQESLSNAYRHGGDIAPTVKVWIVEKNIHLQVKDMGPGIDKERGRVSGVHLGLEVMTERVELLGGEISILAEENSGTEVLAAIPFTD